jgi:hypothetical protein
MGTKTHSALNGIVIKHTECAKLYALGIKPASKTKTVFGLKPAVVGTASGI